MTGKPVSCWNRFVTCVLSFLAEKVKRFRVALRPSLYLTCRNLLKEMRLRKRFMFLLTTAGNAAESRLQRTFPGLNVSMIIDDADKICACGYELSRIGEETSEQLDIIPAKMQVIRHIRPKYACRNCEGVEDDGPTVKIAPVPPRIIPRSIATPGLLAQILTAKFVDHTPFYRQEKQFQRLGVELSRTSMCGWAMQVALSSQPLPW
jgi:transposase